MKNKTRLSIAAFTFLASIMISSCAPKAIGCYGQVEQNIEKTADKTTKHIKTSYNISAKT